MIGVNEAEWLATFESMCEALISTLDYSRLKKIEHLIFEIFYILFATLFYTYSTKYVHHRFDIKILQMQEKFLNYYLVLKSYLKTSKSFPISCALRNMQVVYNICQIARRIWCQFVFGALCSKFPGRITSCIKLKHIVMQM